MLRRSSSDIPAKRDCFGDAHWVFRFTDQASTRLGHQLRGIATDCHEHGFPRSCPDGKSYRDHHQCEDDQAQ